MPYGLASTPSPSSDVHSGIFGGRLLDLASSEKTFFDAKVIAPKEAVPARSSLRFNFIMVCLFFFKKTPIFSGY